MSSAAAPFHEDEGGGDALVSTVSHELRTPLSVIVGYAELLRLREDPETRREASERIEEAAQRLFALIDDLFGDATIDVVDGCVVLKLSPAVRGERP